MTGAGEQFFLFVSPLTIGSIRAISLTMFQLHRIMHTTFITSRLMVWSLFAQHIPASSRERHKLALWPSLCYMVSDRGYPGSIHPRVISYVLHVPQTLAG